MMNDLSALDGARLAQGFMSVAATLALNERGVTVLDPFSTLVSEAAELATGVILWPGTIAQVIAGGRIEIGAGTVLLSGSRIVARGGSVTIGKGVEIGEEGGFTIKADAPEIAITIGDGARLLGGGSLALENYIGRGAQVLGPIRMQQCHLDDGGAYLEPDPDLRGGVLKGSGVARGITIAQGHVIQAFGLFSDAPVRSQSFFHPKRTDGAR